MPFEQPFPKPKEKVPEENIEEIVGNYGLPPYDVFNRYGMLVFRTNDPREFVEYLNKLKKEPQGE
ncbi:MAG: hypothetical protein BWY03_00197 [Parcubacteria group bacterium ADurb.Bin159]|jgi:hypothetical protein|nr:MAG: hypothetical protein BWY03_00197 [Parcubacteria group bacterium ADurb.Bin159]